MSREKGVPIALQMNTFVLDKLRSRISGEELSQLQVEAMQPALEAAQADWPVLTGASKDSLQIVVMEENQHSARVALQAGGEQLINDERNIDKKDYAPFIEFLGTATTSPGTIARAVITNEELIKERLKEYLREWIMEAIR